MPGTQRVMRVNRALAILIVIGMFVQLGVVGYVAYHFWDASRDARVATRAGCERGKQDRASIVSISNGVQGVFTNSNGEHKEMVNPQRTLLLEQIKKATDDVNTRANINCEVAFP